MIADLKPYPAMKDSGVEWLGRVPEHWEVLRLGNLLRERGETNANGEIQEVLSLLRDRGVIPYAKKGNIGNKRSEDITRYKIVRPDDIVVNCMNVIIGSVGLSRYTGCLSPVYYVLTRRSENDDPRYLNAYFQTKPFQKSLIRIGNGILAHRMRIPMELLKCELFPRPPLPEQAAIVHYLDYVDRRIRRYIRAKQKLIGLLEEQKQAIIHRVVTRGLDPGVPLKDSGVEWLGEVPVHWEVKKLHQATNPDRPVRYGIVLPGPNVDEGVYIVKGGNCESGRLRAEHLARTTVEIEAQYARSRLVGQDIVFAIRGGVGAAELLPDELAGANLTQDAARIAAGEGVHPGWLLYAVRAPVFHEHVQSRVVGATVRGINIRDLKRIEVVVPPPDEQTAIVEHLDMATADIDTAIDRARREIDLLREYRTRLIADVVTGKLDVRDTAARLPDDHHQHDHGDHGGGDGGDGDHDDLLYDGGADQLNAHGHDADDDRDLGEEGSS